MARRRKKKNIFKSTINLVLLILILVVIFFLIDKFVLPWYRDRGKIDIKVEKPLEEIKEEPPLVSEEIEIVLYFADDNAEYLLPELRKIKKTNEIAKQAVLELIKGPAASGLYPTIPPATTINALYISDGIAYTDLSRELIKNHPGGSAGELLTAYSLVLTLTSFPDIDKVQILVDGSSKDTLVGHMDVSMPLERDEDWLRK